MPTAVPRWTGSAIVYVVEPPTIETRSDALAAEVRRTDVDAQLVADVERTVRMASRTLGLDPEPRVRWLPANTKNVDGVVFAEALSELWVAVGDPEQTKESALHEVKHVQQYRSNPVMTVVEAERQADEFARTWTWEMTPPVVDQAAAHREWERRYGPMHQAAREYVATRQLLHSRAGRHLGGYGYDVKVIR